MSYDEAASSKPNLRILLASVTLDVLAMALCIPVSAAYMASLGVSDYRQGLAASGNALLAFFSGKSSFQCTYYAITHASKQPNGLHQPSQGP